jgi:alpha-beta hydrolase superfamily lysophospholipase
MNEERFNGLKDVSIFFRSWHPDAKPRAVVAICHGLNAHSGEYLWVGEQLEAAGFAVYALDLRGRGKSDGERFYVDDLADYVGDVAMLIELAKKREPGVPVYLLGHSAGGVVSCVYTLDNQDKIAGLICEDFAFQVPAPDLAIAAVKGISHLAPHAHALKLHNQDFSRDPKVVKSKNDDPLIANEVQPAATVAALARADARLKREFPVIKLPVFILHGTADKVTKPSGSQAFYDNAGSADKTLKLYEGHYHDLLNDLGKEEVMSDILAWIDKRLPRQ